MKAKADKKVYVILYDSACPQCSWFIKKLSFKSPPQILSLGSEKATEYYKDGLISLDPKLSDTMIVLARERELLHWEALVFCIEHSDFPQWVRKVVSCTPKEIGDPIYRVLSFLRDRTGKKDGSCKLP